MAEEVVVSPTILDRRATDELPVHIVPTGDGALVLYNDGSWEQSSFTPVKTNNSLNGGRVAASTARFPVVVDGQKDARSTVGTVLGRVNFPSSILYFDHLAFGFGPSPSLIAPSLGASLVSSLADPAELRSDS